MTELRESFSAGPSAKQIVPMQAETECHRQNGQAWSAIPDDVERHQAAERACEQPGAPNAQHQSADSSEQSEQQSFG